jgi:hypothetical protein
MQVERYCSPRAGGFYPVRPGMPTKEITASPLPLSSLLQFISYALLPLERLESASMAVKKLTVAVWPAVCPRKKQRSRLEIPPYFNDFSHSFPWGRIGKQAIHPSHGHSLLWLDPSVWKRRRTLVVHVPDAGTGDVYLPNRRTRSRLDQLGVQRFVDDIRKWCVERIVSWFDFLFMFFGG